MLVPLVTASSVATAMVALLAVGLGQRWARQDVATRFDGVRRALVDSRYPLTPSILETLAQLTDAHLVLLDPSQPGPQTTLTAPQLNAVLAAVGEGRQRGAGANSSAASDGPEPLQNYGNAREVSGGERDYLVYEFRRSSPAGIEQRVLVLFDRYRILLSGFRAALLPMLAGIVSVGILAVVMHFVTARLAGRLARLQSHVDQMANGTLEIQLEDRSPDEVGQLVWAVNRMAMQLRQLWQRIERQAEEHLLHQIAGGMAHQLRNTLTGARLALELSQQNGGASPDEALETGLRQIEIAEEYVSRLLRVATNVPSRAQPLGLDRCLGDLQAAIRPVAHHLGVHVRWRPGSRLGGLVVHDGAGLYAAVYNLVINALQSGTHVQVEVEQAGSDRVRILVKDDGPGVDPAVAERLFDPFVTTKPEGMGLGLPLVRRVADQLGGRTGWWRSDPWTCFFLEVPVAQGRCDSRTGVVC